MSKIRFDLREGQGYLQRKSHHKVWEQLDNTSLAVLAGLAESVERGHWSECKSPPCVKPKLLAQGLCMGCSWYYRREWTPKGETDEKAKG